MKCDAIKSPGAHQPEGSVQDLFSLTKLAEGQQKGELFKSIVDNLPVSVFVKDDALRIIYLNQACAHRVGLPRDAIIGCSDLELFTPEHAGVFLARDRRIMDTGEPHHTEEETEDRDGVLRVWSTTKVRFTGPNGKHYMVGAQFDVTGERRRQAQLQTLTETVPVGIWRVVKDGETQFVNEQFLSFLGMTREELNCTSAAAKFTGLDRDILASGGQFEADLVGPDGERRRMLIVCSEAEKMPGEPHAAHTICLCDLSELKQLKSINDEIIRLNGELAASLERLKTAQDEIIRKGKLAQLGELTATIAHELRNPLGTVRTSAFLIQKQASPDNEKMLSHLQRINNGILRCDAIITQLLDFARNKPPRMQDESLDDWLETVVREEAEKLAADITCTLDLCGNGRKVAFDPAQMSRVVINLMSNAAEAMIGRGEAEQDAPRFIRIATRITDEMAEFSVSDNGPGISPANLKKILEPLFTTKSFGTGLGLPAARRILESHGGGLRIDSVEGMGATFTAYWPLAVGKTTDELAGAA